MNQKYKWQRARIVYAQTTNERILTGSVCWVRAERPTAFGGWATMNGGGACTEVPCVTSQFVDEAGGSIKFAMEGIELLARDESDFSNDVPLISWQDFLAQCRQNKEPL